MSDEFSHAPREFPPVMVSSTFWDLKEHREAAIKAINKHKLHPHVMEHDDAKLVDMLKSSLQMVQESAGYLLVIGRKYGQVPECPVLNPESLSVTELEFNEALKLGKSILVFIMGDKHPILFEDIEPDAVKKLKLDAFRERAKLMSSTSKLHRVYATFNSIQEFTEQLGSSLAELRDKLVKLPANDLPPTALSSIIPKPPAFYAEPDYIGSHQFVGRQAELDALSDWANRSDPTNLLLFEAIGGNGKSMLSWEWTTKHATKIRADWAGRFWYSFYERGAIMQDFCQRALAYMTGLPLTGFENRKTAELKEELIARLHSHPWLLILDGLERVLVAYHRIDAAEVPDEEANSPTDKILNRNPCDTIRDEDGDLLRALASCSPSKVLISSRLTPRILLNQAGQTITGVRRVTLPGLRPPDAEALFRQCGVRGESSKIQDYLQKNCDNHPLVIGVLAGLIANYMLDRGNFDAWAADVNAGAALNLGELNLIQRRNHILHVALAALSNESRRLLSTLALLSESVDYKTLIALNPNAPPPEPKRVNKPESPEMDIFWPRLDESEKSVRRQRFRASLARWQRYQNDREMWLNSPERRDAPQKLAIAVRDLEQRGLLQYYGQDQRYDLHPVVRGVAAGRINDDDLYRYGERLVDHFSEKPHIPWEKAVTIEDLSSDIQIVRTLLKLGYYQRAADACKGGLLTALCFNLEAHFETLSLLRSFFVVGWGEAPKGVDRSDASDLANFAAVSLGCSGEQEEALAAYEVALRIDLEIEDWHKSLIRLSNILVNITDQNRFNDALRVGHLIREFAAAYGDSVEISKNEFDLFALLSRIGRTVEAQGTWHAFQLMGRSMSRIEFREGEAEFYLLQNQFWLGSVHEEQMSAAISSAERNKDRTALRKLHRLRGAWCLAMNLLEEAVGSFRESVRLARERRLVDAEAEAGLALAKSRLGQLTGDDARLEVERLARLRPPAHRYLAMLCIAIGDPEMARDHAIAAYKWAWADGEPFVHRYELARTAELLHEMNVAEPELPIYDSRTGRQFSWEADVRAATDKLRMEKIDMQAAKKWRKRSRGN